MGFKHLLHPLLTYNNQYTSRAYLIDWQNMNVSCIQLHTLSPEQLATPHIDNVIGSINENEISHMPLFVFLFGRVRVCVCVCCLCTRLKFFVCWYFLLNWECVPLLFYYLHTQLNDTLWLLLLTVFFFAVTVELAATLEWYIVYTFAATKKQFTNISKKCMKFSHNY